VNALPDQDHVPVMLAEVLEVLAPKDGGLYLDGTFGRGGYTRAILEAADCRVVALDRDPAAITAGAGLQARFPDRLTLHEARFGDVDRWVAPGSLDGLALDLGVSSPQLDDAARGFSFRFDGPLDMRMGREGLSAADIVNGWDEAEIADILWRYGEERRSRAIARAVVARRREQPFSRTGDLADLVRSVVRPDVSGIDPATRTFQALRIAVNDELGELERGLSGAERCLAAGGRLAVVSFHSLEDRVVKRFLRERSAQAARPSRHQPALEAGPATFEPLFRNARQPSEEEARRNPRARSARLRAAIRLPGAPPAEGGLS